MCLNIHRSLICAILLLVRATGYYRNGGKHLIFHSDRVSWFAAQLSCERDNGSLARFLSDRTKAELGPEIFNVSSRDSESKFWIGLHRLGGDDWRWIDGSPVRLDQWYVENSLDHGNCSLMMMEPHFVLQIAPCSESWPFLCLRNQGNCTFIIEENCRLDQGPYEKFLKNKTRQQCETLCREEMDFECKSFDYDKKGTSCGLRSDNRWISEDLLLLSDRNWSHHYKKCNYVRVYNGSRGQLTDLPLMMLSSPSETSTVAPSHGYSTLVQCSEAWQDDSIMWSEGHGPTPTSSSASTFSEPASAILASSVAPPVSAMPVDDMQLMSDEIKSKNKLRKKTSTSDHRPSATYVGVTVTSVVIGVLGFIVIIDLITLPQHVRQIHGRKQKSRKRKPGPVSGNDDTRIRNPNESGDLPPMDRKEANSDGDENYSFVEVHGT